MIKVSTRILLKNGRETGDDLPIQFADPVKLAFFVRTSVNLDRVAAQMRPLDS
jgi:hypothetical protein